ncbi:MAG: MoaD/ThiS family protein [Desulfurococcaceae archaeon]
MRVNVKFLMMAKDAAGVSEAFFELTEHSSLRDLIIKIIECSPRISSSVEEFIGKYIVIINGVSPKSIDESLSDGDLVEVMPLVSGG